MKNKKKLQFKVKKNKFITLLMLVLLMVTLSTSVSAVVTDEEIEVVVKQPSTSEVIQQEVPVSNIKPAHEEIKVDSLEEIPELKPEKKPKSLLFKFTVAILWVVISSLIIYFSLISYKKISGKTNFGIDVEENTLNAPKNFKEAVNLFLKKTKDE